MIATIFIAHHAIQHWQGVLNMIILNFFRENIKGSIRDVLIRSYSTKYPLCHNDETETTIEDLIIEPIIRSD